MSKNQKPTFLQLPEVASRPVAARVGLPGSVLLQAGLFWKALPGLDEAALKLELDPEMKWEGSF